MSQSRQEILYRVRFQEKDNKKLVELIVRSVYPSDIMGLVTLEDMVFSDHKKFVILPEEDEARKRFGKTMRLHIPYHNLVFVEEFIDEPVDLAHLPFVRAVPQVEDQQPDA